MIIPSCIAQPRSLAASQPRSLAASQPRSLAASQPKSTPIYIGAQHSRKYLISSMKHLKPATATIACAGIRRMEAGQPSALGMRTCEGKAAGQWLLAMGCAKREHPGRKAPCAAGGALQGATAQGEMASTAGYIKCGNHVNWSLDKKNDCRGFRNTTIQ